MKILDRYIGTSVILGTLGALLFLVSLDVVFALISEIQDIGRSGRTALQAAYITLLTTPRRIYEFFPSAVLLGTLLSLGNLAAHSELVVIRAVGVSRNQIILSVLKAGVLMMIVSVLLGELVAPVSEQQAQNLRKVGDSQRLTLKTADGLWAKDGNRFLNVRDVFPDLRLARIRVYEFDEQRRLVKATYAESATYQNKRWLLKGLRHSKISEDAVETSVAGEEEWDRLLAPELFSVIVVKPEQMSAWKLFRYVNYMKENGLDAGRYELAFWTRFTTPLSSLVLLLLAIPFAFGSIRSGGIGQRLFIGILIGVTAFLVNRLLNNVSLVYGLPPILGAALPLLLFTGVALFAIRRQH